ncbi:MAG: DUF1304 family protein [Oscillospiraceae bacterium]|nr:DUF1304 family protein [Oscillospiraceae bacterium]MDD4369120.1 DUF1304 family protein [Oscillospiraceae bacterium]
MTIVNTILLVLIALEFLFIFYLETIATQSGLTARTFAMEQEELKRPAVNLLFKNQGVYNALIAVLLLVTRFALRSRSAVLLLLGYIILVAVYGGVSSQPKLILKQGGLAILAFILILMFGL